MELLSYFPIRYFYNFILVFLLSEVAICVDIGNQKQKSQSFVGNTTKSSTETLATSSTETTQLAVELTIKASTKSSLVDDLEKATAKSAVSHDNIPNNSGLPQHSTDSTTAYKLLETSSVLNSSSIHTSTASIATPTTSLNLSTSISLTIPVHRKSKPEETHIDDIVQDSGPTTDYVVPLVVAMLAVPLVGVLCALLYIKGRDFWERRHYGRIDFLWDSRNDGRMDFLIDGMYRE